MHSMHSIGITTNPNPPKRLCHKPKPDITTLLPLVTHSMPPADLDPPGALRPSANTRALRVSVGAKLVQHSF